MDKTTIEYRIAYDVRAYGREIGTYEVPLSDPTSLPEATSRLATTAEDGGRQNPRVEQRTVTTSGWEAVSVPDSKDNGEKPWPPEVEMVIDVCDDPPRPFLARTLERSGTAGYDWREDGDYLTERYLPLQVIRERLEAEAKELRDGAETLRDQASIASQRGSERESALCEGSAEARENAADRFDAALAAFSKEEGS